MREDITSAKEVIKALLKHVGGTQALAQLDQGQSAESIVVSLLGRDASATAETATIMPSNDPPLTRPPKDPGSEPAAEATEQTNRSLLHDQAMADLPESWAWLESNYQLESTQQLADICTVQSLTNEPKATEPRQQVEHETGKGAEIGPDEFISAQQWSHGIKSAPGSWTAITDDVELVHHLLALYFCWEYPTFVTLSREHFIYDFRTGSHKYCSPMLVNALLAMGCRFSSQRVGRGISDDPFSSGDLFFQESERLLECAPVQHSLPVVQALGVMSLRELSCGRHMAAKHLAGQAVRIAIEMGLHAPRETEHTPDDLLVMSATFWGVYA
ncbi:MAG: fungal specific transcription factor domain-containing protein, partial [Candidatus Binatia bacterium]